MPNALLIMVDELSWWALGNAGRGVSTPNIDRLAARGTRFDAAYTPSPICVPARAALATGRHVHEIGNWSSAEAYSGATPSWGHALQQSGVSVTSIGKLHYRSGKDDTGFDCQIEPIHIPGGVGWQRGLLRRPLCSYDATAELAEMIGPGESDYTAFDRRVTAETLDYLAEPGRKSAPWAAFVSYLSPHYPLLAPQEYYSLYDPKDFESGAEEVPEHPILAEMAAFWSYDSHFAPETRGIARAAYFGLCSFIDAEVGKVLDALETNGLDDTLVIFASDHGEMLGERGFWTKSVMYESSVRVPMIMAGPGVAPGVRTDPVSLIDCAPTICDALGCEAEFSGRSMLAPADPQRSVISEYHDGGVSVGITMLRWGDWKYVHYAEGHPAQLFHLPDEDNDLSDQRPDIVEVARRKLAEFSDPEVVNERAHSDQLREVERRGGREALLEAPQWNYTPPDSR